ncbi:MAG: hypothetical protein K8I02_10340, partial [Candidatus Methylomirabilis sp.]|nr:hypothetical protein [Deltaproteobacteria bacterium]
AYTARFGYESPARPGFRDVYVRTLDDGEPVLASVSSEGVQPDGDSYDAVLSAAGSVVAFVSEASNLVPDDTNGVHDIFVRDLETGRTERVSVASDGAEANGPSYHRPTISADGRFVGFWSAATNLVADDTNARGDAFVHDRLTGLTTRESVGTGGVQASSDDPPSLSADGRFLAFSSGAATIRPPTQASGDYLYLRDRWNDLTTPVGRKDNGYPMRGEEPVLSADAAAVAFVSDSELNGSLLEAYRDVFVADAVTGETVKASAALGGARTINGSGFPAIGADGRFVAFSSLASNLVPGDSNGASDVFVFDRMTASLTRESVHDDGSQRADGGSSPALDGTGGVVAFYSFETRVELYLDQEVFIRNRATGTVQIAAPDARGVQGDAASGSCGVSADGRRVAFASRASNLVAGDQNRYSDVFVADLSKRTLRRASVSSQGAEADGDSQGQPSLSADGRFVAFQSNAGNLAPDDADPLFNVFVHDTVGGAT